MADSKDAPSPSPSPSPLQAPQSPVDALFQRVDSWGLEALGGSAAAGAGRPALEEDLLPRERAQPLSGWSLFEAAAAAHAEAAAAAANAEPEPEAPSPSEIYAAHERSHDSAGNDNPFVDPASLALAMYGGPALEPASKNPGSLAAMSQPRAASGADKAAPPISTNAVLGLGDAILTNGASLFQEAAAPRAISDVWKKLWRY